jgi:hypothetical protein
MLTLSDLLSEVYAETGLNRGSKDRIISRLNDLYLQVCGEKDWKWLEYTHSITTVSDTSAYDLNIENLQVKSVWLEETATLKHVPMREIINPVEWDTIFNYYNSGTSDHPYLYHIREGKLNIYPKSSTADYTIKVLCLVNPTVMEIEDYFTGSIAVTNGDATVTSSGTAWSSSVKGGSYIKIKRSWYKVSSVTSDTALELTQVYQGTTESGITDYKIGDAPILPKNFHSILWKMFCEEYYTKNTNATKKAFYERMVVKQRIGLDKLSGSQTTSNIWDNNPTQTEYYGVDPYTVYSD